MKNLQQWMGEYAVSHQNETNKKVHLICVPLIFFSVVGLIMSIPNEWLSQQLYFLHPIFTHWAIPVLILLFIFYVRLSFSLAIKILLFALICVGINYWISTKLNLLYCSISIFAFAWVGQFYGHKIEGKKPSFLHDLQFLFIGPAWILHEFFGHKRGIN